MRLTNKREFLSGLVLVFFGLGALLIARNYKMGTAFRMGPGYFPVMLAVLLMGIGIIILLTAFRSGETRSPKMAWRPLLMITAAVVLFGSMVKGIGLLLAVFIMVVVSRFARPGYSWIETMILGVFLSLLFSTIFYYGLKIQMPLLPTWSSGS